MSSTPAFTPVFTPGPISGYPSAPPLATLTNMQRVSSGIHGRPVSVLTPGKESHLPRTTSSPFPTLHQLLADDRRPSPMASSSYSTDFVNDRLRAHPQERTFHVRPVAGNNFSSRIQGSGIPKPRHTSKRKRRIVTPSSNSYLARIIRLIKLLFCCCCYS